MIDFPTLQPNNADFKEDIDYQVEAKQTAGKLAITHSLTGESFIKQLILEEKARFSVALFYKNSAQRKYSVFEEGPVQNKNSIIAKQLIPNEFSYGPNIKANILTTKRVEITIDKRSGLDSSFWQFGSKIDIPSHARIALYPDLSFGDGNISSLISIKWDKGFGKGEIEVKVNKVAGAAERPIKVLCAEDVFDQLHNIGINTPNNPKDERDVIRLAIVTQILSAAYGEIIKDKDEEVTNDNLTIHLDELNEKTGQDWRGEDFYPSLAATKMLPYQLKILKED